MDFSHPATIVFLCIISIIAAVEIVAPIVAGYASDSDSSDDALCVGALVAFFGEVVLVVLGAGCQIALETNPGATVPNVLVWWAVLINLPYSLSWFGSFLAANK